MTLEQDKLRALIDDIDALLGEASPRLPWVMAGETTQQRQLLEKARAYLDDLQQGADVPGGWGPVNPETGQLVASDGQTGSLLQNPQAEAASQVLQALLQEMQYLRSQTMQILDPLRDEVSTLRQEREMLLREVRQLELQRVQTQATDPQGIGGDRWEALVQLLSDRLNSQISSQLDQSVRRLETTAANAYLLSSAPEQLQEAADTPALNPSQRLEQLKQIQAQSDQLVVNLDTALRTVFESLQQSVQSYHDSLGQGLHKMHTLGKQGEMMFDALIEHLAHQMSQNTLAYLESTAGHAKAAPASLPMPQIAQEPDLATALQEDWPAAIAKTDVDLDDEAWPLADLDLDAALGEDEEITLLQLDEEITHLQLDEEEVAMGADNGIGITDMPEPDVGDNDIEPDADDLLRVLGQLDAAEPNPISAVSVADTFSAAATEAEVSLAAGSGLSNPAGPDQPDPYQEDIDELHRALFGDAFKGDDRTIDNQTAGALQTDVDLAAPEPVTDDLTVGWPALLSDQMIDDELNDEPEADIPIADIESLGVTEADQAQARELLDLVDLTDADTALPHLPDLGMTLDEAEVPDFTSPEPSAPADSGGGLTETAGVTEATLDDLFGAGTTDNLRLVENDIAGNDDQAMITISSLAELLPDEVVSTRSPDQQWADHDQAPAMEESGPDDLFSDRQEFVAASPEEDLLTLDDIPGAEQYGLQVDAAMVEQLDQDLFNLELSESTSPFPTSTLSVETGSEFTDLGTRDFDLGSPADVNLAADPLQVEPASPAPTVGELADAWSELPPIEPIQSDLAIVSGETLEDGFSAFGSPSVSSGAPEAVASSPETGDTDQPFGQELDQAFAAFGESSVPADRPANQPTPTTLDGLSEIAGSEVPATLDSAFEAFTSPDPVPAASDPGPPTSDAAAQENPMSRREPPAEETLESILKELNLSLDADEPAVGESGMTLDDLKAISTGSGSTPSPSPVSSEGRGSIVPTPELPSPPLPAPPSPVDFDPLDPSLNLDNLLGGQSLEPLPDQESASPEVTAENLFGDELPITPVPNPESAVDVRPSPAEAGSDLSITLEDLNLSLETAEADLASASQDPNASTLSDFGRSLVESALADTDLFSSPPNPDQNSDFSLDSLGWNGPSSEVAPEPAVTLDSLNPETEEPVQNQFEPDRPDLEINRSVPDQDGLSLESLGLGPEDLNLDQPLTDVPNPADSLRSDQTTGLSLADLDLELDLTSGPEPFPSELDISAQDQSEEFGLSLDDLDLSLDGPPLTPSTTLESDLFTADSSIPDRPDLGLDQTWVADESSTDLTQPPESLEIEEEFTLGDLDLGLEDSWDLDQPLPTAPADEVSANPDLPQSRQPAAGQESQEWLKELTLESILGNLGFDHYIQPDDPEDNPPATEGDQSATPTPADLVPDISTLGLPISEAPTLDLTDPPSATLFPSALTDDSLEDSLDVIGPDRSWSAQLNLDEDTSPETANSFPIADNLSAEDSEPTSSTAPEADQPSFELPALGDTPDLATSDRAEPSAELAESTLSDEEFLDLEALLNDDVPTPSLIESGDLEDPDRAASDLADLAFIDLDAEVEGDQDEFILEDELLLEDELQVETEPLGEAESEMEPAWLEASQPQGQLLESPPVDQAQPTISSPVAKAAQPLDPTVVHPGPVILESADIDPVPVAVPADESPLGPISDSEPSTDSSLLWFLGLDIGVTGLSAVLLQVQTGQVYPLYWIDNTIASVTADKFFRLPAIASLALAEDGGWQVQSVGSSALTVTWDDESPSEDTGGSILIKSLKPYLRLGIPHPGVGAEASQPLVTWADNVHLPLVVFQAAIQQLLETLHRSLRNEGPFSVGAIGLETGELAQALQGLQGVTVGYPANWPDTYSFNLREAVLSAGLVASPDQIYCLEDGIAAVLSGLPDPNQESPAANAQPLRQQTLYACDWTGGTVVISAGATVTEMGIVNLPRQLRQLSYDDFILHSMSYAGDAIDLDIISHLLHPAERRQPRLTNPYAHPTGAAEGWGWQAALPELESAQWVELGLDGLELPRPAEPDLPRRYRLQQRLESSLLGQSVLEATRHLKLILQHQPQFDLELADQRWSIRSKDLEDRIILPYIQRINGYLNRLLSEIGLTTQGINQVICTGGSASIPKMARWLRQKFPNATIVQDTYQSDRPPSCSRVAYGLVNLVRYPQVLDLNRHQYSDTFLLMELLRTFPDQPMPLSGIFHLLEERGINTQACELHLIALLEGRLPPGLVPGTSESLLLYATDAQIAEVQALTQTPLFARQGNQIYVPNMEQCRRLQAYMTRILADKHQTLEDPLISQLMALTAKES